MSDRGEAGEMITVALLDIDGTLVDSNDAHAHAWAEAFEEAGFAVGFENVRPLIGMGGDKLLPAVDGSLNDTDEPGKTIAKRRGDIFKARYRDRIAPFLGVRDLLVRLNDAGIICVVATSAEPDELESMLRLAAIEDLITASVTSEDVGESKPAPDLITVALTKSKVRADAAIMIGDTRFDIEAARAAGVGTIAFRCGGAPPGDLRGAIAIFDGPAALSAALERTTLTALANRVD